MEELKATLGKMLSTQAINRSSSHLTITDLKRRMKITKTVYDSLDITESPP